MMACGNVTGGGIDVASWLFHTALLSLTAVQVKPVSI